jgi:hypothetical protein
LARSACSGLNAKQVAYGLNARDLFNLGFNALLFILAADRTGQDDPTVHGPDVDIL